MRTMKARWGLLWNQKLAYRWKLAPSPNCPLCHQPDSVGHLLGGCTHKDAKAMKIARHDQSVKLIQKAIALGDCGGHYMVMDAGAVGDLPEDVMGKRVPSWLFPPISPDLTPEQQQTEAERRRKMRPDILVAEGLETKDTRGTEAEVRTHVQELIAAKKLQIHILEVGYCSDIDRDAKDFDKRKQHEDLVALLRSGGHDVRFHDPVTLGRCGSIPTSLIYMLKNTFHISAARAEEYAHKLNRHAVHYVDKMYNHRQTFTFLQNGGQQNGRMPSRPG